MSIEKNNTAVAAAPRRRKNPEAKAAFRDEVVAIARQLFAEEGFESVSLRTIAARAGCSPMTLYVYFPNKLAMLRFIWADIFKAVFAEMEAAMAVQPDAPSKLRAYGLAWFHYWLTHPENYRVVFMNQDEGTYHAKVDQEGLDQPFFADGELAMAHRRQLCSVFEDGMANGEIRKMMAERCVQVFLAQLLGGAHGIITVPEFNWDPVDELTVDLVEACVRGFRPD